jgi:outer membrane protein
MLKLGISVTILLTLACPAFAVEYSLDDLYRIALDRSERIRVSGEDLYIAGTTKAKAKSVLLPRLTAFTGYTGYKDNKNADSGTTIQPLDQLNWGMRLDQTMSLSGREITAFRITEEGIVKSRYDFQAVREGYLFTVAGAFYDHLKARRLVDTAEANVQRLTKHRDAAGVRVKVGEVTKTALLRAEAELSGARSDLVKAQNSAMLTRAILARVVGIDEDFVLRETPRASLNAAESDFIVEGCRPLTAECAKEKAWQERPELKSFETQKRIAEDQVRYTKGSYYPSLSVQGVYSKTDQTKPVPGLIREALYSGVSISFPFFEGGLRTAEVNEAEARKRQADYLLADARKSVGIDVENAYLDFVTQEGVLKSLQDQVAFAQDNYNAVSRQFEFGLANSLDVMDANTLLVNAERQLLDALYSYYLSATRLKRVTGLLLRSVVNSDGAAGSIRSRDEIQYNKGERG